MSRRTLAPSTMLAFGIGQAAEGFKTQAFNVFLLFYYQQVLGVSGVLVGLALGIGLMFDAITDPAAGVLSDRYNSRWGRRHPFIFISAFPLFIAFYLLFNPPPSLSEFESFLWLTTFVVLVRGSLTFFHVPHLALGADMAQDYDQRSSLFALSSVFGITGMALVGIVGYGYFFPTSALFSPGMLNPDAYWEFSLCVAIAMFMAIMICCFGTASEIPYLHQSKTDITLSARWILRSYREVFSNKSFQVIFVGMLMLTFVIAVEAILSPFMGIHFWGMKTEELAILPISMVIGLWIGYPVTSWLTRLVDKKLALIVPAIFIFINANVATVLRLCDVDWFPDNQSPWIFWIILLRYLLHGICLPVVLASFNSMFADIADEVELHSGERREGVIYSARSFANKTSSALGAILGGALLDMISFPSQAVAGSVSENVVWWLGATEGPIMSCVSIMGILFFFRYKITRARHTEIVEQIAQRKAGKVK
ncbi:MAG: MFS transporter [Pseudomonadales bacterium]|nr:MFS transporter [Pseudomonadales bacterium]